MSKQRVVLPADPLGFPDIPRGGRSSEVQSKKIEMTDDSRIRIVQTHNRFARLKKSMRRRPGGIL
ncbi:MAG: hypothetical protein JSS81_28380 [Acidobacteria bacterium]|nr:hypothetical protein [Acidobacteriota bacterium]